MPYMWVPTQPEWGDTGLDIARMRLRGSVDRGLKVTSQVAEAVPHDREDSRSTTGAGPPARK